MHSELRIAPAAAPPELRIAPTVQTLRIGDRLEKPQHPRKTYRFFEDDSVFRNRAIDFSAKMSGNLGFGRNPSVSNCPGLPFLLEGPPVSHRYTRDL